MVSYKEKLYAKTVIHRIVKYDMSFDEKFNLLVDFHFNSRKYYDLLCDYLYLLSNKKSDLSLWISLNGKPTLSFEKPNIYDINVMDPLDVPEFEGDLVNYLETIIHNLSKN